jgi:hypothetical protein
MPPGAAREHDKIASSDLLAASSAAAALEQQERRSEQNAKGAFRFTSPAPQEWSGSLRALRTEAAFRSLAKDRRHRP